MIYAKGLALDHLDLRTRTFMVSELNADLAAGCIYLSPWLTDEGRRQWPELLRIALHALENRREGIRSTGEDRGREDVLTTRRDLTEVLRDLW